MAQTGHNHPPEAQNCGPYAIYRHVKHSQTNTIRAASRHMMRSLVTPNADPARFDRNKIIIGTNDPAGDVSRLLPALDERGADGQLRRRKNSVLSIEVLLTASPEWFETASPQDVRDWESRSVEWLKSEYGAENIAHLQLHMDEKTPHLTGLIVPIDPYTGRLNARRWIGGAERCSQQQTDYAASVESLGLQRGIEGSKATHQRVQSHYADLNKPTTEVRVDQPPRFSTDPAGWAADQNKKIEAAIAPLSALAKEARAAGRSAEASKATARAATSRAEAAEAALAESRAIAAQMRSLPLPDVLSALGFAPDKEDPAKWKAPGFIIGVGTGSKAAKWFDHQAQVGKGGAIDLVGHVLGADFKGAVAWLADRFGPGAAAADVTARLKAQAAAKVEEAVRDRDPFTPPKDAPEHWPNVRKYLVEERGLDASYVDRLFAIGDLYADAKQNAVFICKDPDTGRITGAELKGTHQRSDGSRFTGLAVGSRKDAGGFRVGNVLKASAVYLVESAIDAISLFKLRHSVGERGHAVVSLAGVRPKPPRFLDGLAEGVRRVCAFDADEAGDRAARSLRSAGWQRLRPTKKDWNDDLRTAQIAPRAEKPSNLTPDTERAEKKTLGGPSSTTSKPRGSGGDYGPGV